MAIPVLFILGGFRKKINVFDAFIEGAKGGLETSFRIIPYLVAMLAGISVFRACGALDYLVDFFKWGFSFFHIDTRFTEVLPIAFMRPISGSGARAMMLDNMRHFGTDTFIGHLSSVLYGSADTTFYIVAPLFWFCWYQKKHATPSPAGLISDAAGIIAAILLSYLFFCLTMLFLAV